MSDFKLPPQAIEFEQSILAAIMLESGAAAEIFETLQPADFYRGTHQRLFKTAQKVHQQGEPIDAKILGEALQSKGLLESIGGAAYIFELLETPFPSSVAFYCQKIKQKACLRWLIEICTKTAQNCYQVDDPEALIETAQQQILSLQTDDKGQASSIEDLLHVALERFESLQKNQGRTTGTPSYYPDLDAILNGYQWTDLIILAARPSMGKTAFAICNLVNIGARGTQCGIISLEMSKEQIIDRVAAVSARVNSGKFRSGRFFQSDWESITKAFSRLSKCPIWFDDLPDSRFLSIRKRVRQMVKQGVKIIFVDYLQLITGGNQQNRNLDISEITRGLKLLAKELQIPIILLSQLSRNCEQRDDKRPRLSDLRDSGAIEQDADVVMFLYRDEVYRQNSENKGIAELSIAKHRNGPVGTIGLYWNAVTTSFHSMSRGE